VKGAFIRADARYLHVPHGLDPILDSPHGPNALVMRRSICVRLLY
jgi:hypothetical protein